MQSRREGVTYVLNWKKDIKQMQLAKSRVQVNECQNTRNQPRLEKYQILLSPNQDINICKYTHVVPLIRDRKG